jgi:hypothetical protein
MKNLPEQHVLEGPPSLLAIMRAARALGDRQLERVARRELSERYGIEVTIRRESEEGARHAD